MEKYKKVFVNPRSNRNRIELNPTAIADPNPLPNYTYGSGSNETFPGIFPTVRKEGVGVVADASTPTFSSAGIGEGKEMEFFDTKKKIKDIIKKQLDIEKSKIYLSPGEKPPKGVQVMRGPKGGYYYEGLLPGRKSEKKTISSQSWERPEGQKSHSGVVIPKTWDMSRTFINRDPNARIQVSGINPYGEPQVLNNYNDRTKAIAKKQKRMKSFHKDSAKIFKRIEQDSKKDDRAMISKIQFMTSCRIGSSPDTKGKVPSFGVSTLLRKHVKTKGDVVYFDFPGKDGVRNTDHMKDAVLAAKINKIQDPNQRIFNAKYKDVIKYLRDISGGKQYGTHDFRSHRATVTALSEVKKYPMPTTQKELRKTQIAVAKQVAIKLKNNYGVCLNTYIHPDVWTPMEVNLMNQEEPKKIKKAVSGPHLNYFEDIDDMFNTVHYVLPEAQQIEKDVKGEIDNYLEKAKIYLGVGGQLPHGKRLMFGPKGGRYYETDLEVYRHFWERVKERKMREEKIQGAINFLNTKNLPSSEWWFEVDKVGIITGHANQVQTVLEFKMAPLGIRINPD